MADESDDVSVRNQKVCDFKIQTLYCKSKKNSSCWKHFGKLVWEKDNKKKHVLTDQVFCEICLNNAQNQDSSTLFGLVKIKSYSSSVSTGNLIRHLKEEHNISDAEKEKKAIANIKTFFTPRPRPSTNTAANHKWLLARDLAIWFCRSLMPFDSVADEGMTEFFQKYGVIVASEDLPTRTTISRDALQDVYDSLLYEVKRETSKAGQHVAMTTDLWSDSYRHRNYITFTLHYLDENMALYRFTLDTILILEKKTGERIKEEIQAVRERFGLIKNQVFLVTDSGSNVKKAATLIDDVTSHFCLGHGLHNLEMVDGIATVESLQALIQKSKKIAKALRFRAPELEQEAEKEQRLILTSLQDPNMYDGGDSESNSDDDDTDENEEESRRSATTYAKTTQTIKTESKTRWHSLLTMLESLSHPNNKGPVNNLLGKISKNHLKVTDAEWHIMQQLIQVLKKIRTAVEILSSDLNCTINVALVLRNEIEDILRKTEDRELIAITALKKRMLDRLDYRFPITDTLIASSLLDPRFQKLKTIDLYLESRIMTRPDFIANYVANDLQLKDVDSTSVQLQMQQPSTSQASEAMLLSLANKYSEETSTFTSPVESEAWKYFCSASANDVTHGILQYWEQRKRVYPWLYATARAILSIPATSTPSERVFSIAGLTLNAKRSRLHPSRVNKIIFIHDNYSKSKKGSS